MHTGARAYAHTHGEVRVTFDPPKKSGGSTSWHVNDVKLREASPLWNVGTSNEIASLPIIAFSRPMSQIITSMREKLFSFWLEFHVLSSI